MVDLSGPRDDYVVVDGLRLRYRDWGGTGRPVVLLHGLASTCRIWDLAAPLLSESLAVLALDQRGHGESGKPDDGYDFETVCGDLRGFIRAMGIENPILVGHSWGADVALEYAAAHPDTVCGLALVDGGTLDISGSPGLTLERAKRVMAPPDFTGTTMDELIEMVRSRPFGAEMTDEIEAIVLACFEALEDGAVRARLSRRNHMRIIEAFWSHRPREVYPGVACPVLLMPARHPDGDGPVASALRLDKAEAISLAEALLPISETVWLEDSIHDVPVQRPELVAGVIRRRVESGFFG